MKKLLPILLVSVVFWIVYFYTNYLQNTISSTPEPGTISFTTGEETPLDNIKKDIKRMNDIIENKKLREYRSSEDKMTSKKINHASIVAQEKLYFAFPYEWGTFVVFNVREKNNGTDIMLSITKWQFASSYSNPSVTIRFDDKKAKKYTISNPSDGSYDMIFIDWEKDIIKNLKISKKMLIEASFYNEGTKQLEFNVSGFKM